MLDDRPLALRSGYALTASAGFEVGVAGLADVTAFDGAGVLDGCADVDLAED